MHGRCFLSGSEIEVEALPPPALFQHEAPDLNRDRDATFEVGDVFSCEPGAYSNDLRVGIRLENTFLVTEDGVENLSEYPLEIVPES